MPDLATLKRVKGGLRASITRLSRDLDAIIIGETRLRLKALVTTIKETLAKIETTSDSIYALLTSDEEFRREIENDADYRSNINIVLIRLQTAIDEPLPGTATGGKTVKLPKLTLPTFEGDPMVWTSFWDVFKYSVHDNLELSSVQKLSYLRGQLKGDAAQLIKGFKVENSSYAVAIELLQKTYGQEDKIKAALINNLYDMASPSYEVESLKSFYASYESTIRSMHNLNVSADEICTVVLLNKVPSPLKEIIKREMKSDTLDLQTFSDRYQAEVFNMSDPVGQLRTTLSATATFATPVEDKSKFNGKMRSCKLCASQNHIWFKCTKYQQNAQKINRAQHLNLCKGCLSSEHGSQGCTSPYVRACKHCKGRHYHMLCPKPREGQPVANTTTTATCNVSAKSKQTTILPTIRLPIDKKGGGSRNLKIMLDQCSQRSFVLRSVLPTLKYVSNGFEELQLQGFTKISDPKNYEVVTLQYTYHGRNFPLSAVVVDSLPNHGLQNSAKNLIKRLQNKGFRLADTQLIGSGEVQMLIGADYYYDIVHPGYIREGSIVLLPTIRGYALSGAYSTPNTTTKVDMVTILKVAVNPTEKYFPTSEVIPCTNDLNTLWDLDNIGIVSKDLDSQSKLVLQRFDDEIQYDRSSSQYKVKLPWNAKRHLLKSNYGLALGRLRGLQRKFIGSPQYLHAYQQIFEEQEKRGFIERVVEEDNTGGDIIHYLPHHSVKKDSVTTPIRVVFDCSASDNKNPSLNDCLETGPSLVPDLTKVLLRFRLNKYAWVSDIEKAFLMVKLHEDDRDATRFLWPINPTDLNSPCQVFRFKVVLFGATCSQFLLNATILHHMSTVELHPDTCRDIKNGLYIDNLQHTADSEEELQEHHWTARRIFSKANLILREWATNSPLLYKQLVFDNVAASDQEVVKMLGMKWLPAKDVITYNIKSLEQPVTTKRQCLSVTAQLFDPMGMLLPVTIRARLGLQHLWRLKVGWDEILPSEVQNDWRSLLLDYAACSQHEIQRRVTNCQEVSIHAFSDASTVAYGTALYIVGGGQSTLLIAKAKVAPIKPVTVPKLELTAVLLSARLLDFVKEAFKGILKIADMYLWCDSQIALHWLSNTKTKPLYVIHRVDEITTLVPTAKIRYIQSEDNPADLVTRGLTAVQLANTSLWWQGPQWLPVKEQWPEEKLFGETRQLETVANALVTDHKQDIPIVMDWSRYGSYNKVVRIMAWVKRYVNNLRLATQGTAFVLNSVLSLKEERTAENTVIKLVQNESYP